MIKRIKLAYFGALGLPILLLPIAMINTMGGHSLMYLCIISSPVGLLAALSYSDSKRKYDFVAILVRFLMSMIVLISSIALIVFLSESSSSVFLINQGWVLIALLSPLITAASTEKILATRTKGKNENT